MRLIDLLHQRRGIAEKFTESFQKRVEQDLKFYRADPPNELETLNIDLVESVNRRYAFNIPLIFTNHESMMASMFDRVPDLIFNQRGQDDYEKEQKVIAAYEYLKDKLDLETFMTSAAWWFILSGFASAHIGYAQKAVDKPAMDDNGQPILDEEGKPVTYVDYAYDDPTLEVGDPKKEVYSPESEFKIDSSLVPYYLRYKMIHPEEIKRIYKKDVEPDSVVDGAEQLKDDTKKDVDRVKTWFYYGTLPKDVSGEVKSWDPEKNFMVIFTHKEILHKEELQLNQKQCRIVKWHGAPNEFFGFGLGKLLRPFQREKSIRRGQQVRYADVAAYPKLLLPGDTEFDKKTYKDPREGLIITFNGEQKPEYLAPPNLGQVVNDANNLADQDAQQVSGMMDISNGAQQSQTVDTATGQTIFADAAEKRVRFAKKRFMKFYREVVILLLKMCQANWKSEKLIDITDDDGQSMRVGVTSEDLSDIDFDLDVDIDVDTVSINKDVLREQAIALYDRIKDDPTANRKEALKFAIEEGFGRKNADKFIAEPVAPPGTQLVDQATGATYLVDEAGNLTTPEVMGEMRPPSGEGIGADPGAIMAGAQ
jgi:hypothetical protein